HHPLQVMVQRASRILPLIPPRRERVRCDLDCHLPAAAVHQAKDTPLEQPRPTSAAPTMPARFQVGDVILQVLFQWPLGRVPYDLRFENSRRLALFLLDKLTRQLLGHLLVSHPEGLPTVCWHIGKPIPQMIATRFPQIPILPKPPLFHRENHAAPPPIIACTWLRRNRTAPRY